MVVEVVVVVVVVVVVIIFVVVVVDVIKFGLQTIFLDLFFFMHADLSKSKAFASFVISQFFENKEQKVLRTT